MDDAPKLLAPPSRKICIVIEGEVSEEFIGTFKDQRLFHKFLQSMITQGVLPDQVEPCTLRAFDIIPDGCPTIGCTLSEYHSGDHDYPRRS